THAESCEPYAVSEIMAEPWLEPRHSSRFVENIRCWRPVELAERRPVVGLSVCPQMSREKQTRYGYRSPEVLHAVLRFWLHVGVLLPRAVKNENPVVGWTW